jgi:hypothetical protein
MGNRMSASFVFAVAMIIFVGSVARRAAASALTNAVGIWMFDEGTGTTFQDSTGNAGNTGTFEGGDAFDTVTKKYGTSSMGSTPIFSSGYGGRVDGFANGLTNNFTVEGWLRMSDNTGFPTFISRADTATGHPNELQWVIGTSPNVDGNRLDAFVYDSDSGANVGDYTDPIATPINLNTWYHVAMTFLNGNVKLYVNGVQALSATNAAVNPSGVGRLVIGSDAIESGITDRYPWRGNIDDVRISNVVLPSGDGSGDGTLAWNASLASALPEPSSICVLLLSVAMPVARRSRALR